MAIASHLATASHLTTEVAPASSPRPRSDRRHSRPQAASDRAAAKRLELLLFRRYHGDGDLHARRQLIERYLPLARILARRYQRRGEPLDDLVQVASVGLIKAIERFDPEREFSFSSYAVPTMLGELRRYFRDAGWALHVPRDLQERVLKVHTAVEIGRAHV